jgi:hypothetical protein
MNKNYKLIDKQINEIKDLIELKQFLNKTFDNQHNIKEKETFLDYLELDYLFNKKVRFEADKIKLDQLKTNFFNPFYLQAKLKIEFFENWIIEKRKEILENQPEPKFNEKIPTKNLDELKGKCEGIYWNLKFNSNDKTKMIEIINENSDDLSLSNFYAIQEIKRLHHSEIKSKAKYYLDYIKKYENDVTELLNEAIEQKVLVRFNLNQFNIHFLGHLKYFIDEVERFTGLSESEPPTATKNEIVQPKQENEIEHPFSITGNFELFKYLDKCFKPENIAKYTYIFDFIKDKEKLETTLNEKLYFEYIAKLKPNLELKTFRPQPTATNEKKQELVKKLYQIYLDETKK